MDALEFLKEVQRICVKHKESCKTFLAYTVCNGKLGKTDEELEEVVKNIEQWSKEHPKKTYKDVFLKVFPSAKLDDGGTPNACIRDIFGDSFGNCDLECSECWNQEYKEDEE